MSEIARLIQRQVPLGSNVEILLKNGERVSGILDEISTTHLTLKRPSGTLFSCMMDMVGSWELLSQETNGAGRQANAGATEGYFSPSLQTTGSSASQIMGTNAIPASLSEKTQRKLAEIDAFFESKVQAARSEIESPDLHAPVDEMKQSTSHRDLLGKWDSIHQRYRYAIDHDIKRLPMIIVDLKLLIQGNPSLKSLRRVLPYFQYIAEKFPDALKSYKELCLMTQSANDWYNLAALALKMNETLLACYALEQVFTRSPLQSESPEWYIYIKLIKASENYFLLRRLYTSLKEKLQKDEEQLFLETCIYLLKRTGKEDTVSLLIRSWYQETSTQYLIESALNNFGEVAYNPYRDILSEMASLQQGIANERKKSEIVVKRQPVSSNSSAKVASSSASSETGPYRQAKLILDKGKEREKAIPLLYEAIEKRDNPESAIRLLVSHYSQLNQQDNIIALLKKYEHIAVSKRNSMLTEAYWQTKQYKETIEPLTLAIKELPGNAPLSKRVYMYQQMGICYMQVEQFEKAQEWFEKIIEIKEDHIAAKRNIAICLIKRGNYEAAEQKLNELLPDVKAAELLEEIAIARVTGQTIQVDKIISEVTISNEMTEFTQFFLKCCNYEGVPPGKVPEKNFSRSDIEELESLATQAKMKRPRIRAEYYLSAAKISFEGPQDLLDIDRTHRYLCRSFTSLGDDAVVNQKSLDTACEWYSEALRVYGGDKRRGNDEGARFALVRFLYASMGKHEDIPMENVPEACDALEHLLSSHDAKKIFSAITYLITRSEYAAEMLLPIMYDSPSIREKSLQYLQEKEISTPTDEEVTWLDFKIFWKKQLRDQFNKNIKVMYTQLDLIKKVELTNLSSVENCLKRIHEIEQIAYLHRDTNLLGELKRILSDVRDLCKQTAFEEKDRLCTQIIEDCRKLLKEEIELSPTILSVEKIYPIVSKIQQQTEIRHQEIQTNFTPQITLRLPDGMDSQTLVGRNIEVQIAIENKAGCSPADTPELLVKKEPTLFELNEREIRLDGLLRGGNSEILPIPLTLTDEAIKEKAFSLSVRAQYRTYSGEICKTPLRDFSIQLDSSEEFQNISPNPYGPYASGAKVEKESMFYGRDDFIANVISAIRAAETQSKSFAIYGQMRSGKTSILHHLMKKLGQDTNYLVVDIGSIGLFSHEAGDDAKKASTFYQILWKILFQIQRTIKQKVATGFPPLYIDLPEDVRDFYEHPTPHEYFVSLLETFLQKASQTQGWQNIKIIVCIDEFTYIYEYITKGTLSDNFMRYWKAILQENLFSTILVGQDAMPKFINQFFNEFGVIDKFRVTYLDRKYAKQLIENPILLNGDSRYKENAVDYIIRLTAGSPFFIQILCNWLVIYMNRNKRKFITEADVKNVKDELITGAQQANLESQFNNIIMSGDVSSDAISKEDAEAVLKNIASYSSDGFCRHDDIKCPTTSSIDDILKDLEMREVIERDANQYRIKVELYKEWLLENL